MPKPNGKEGQVVFSGTEWAKLAGMFTAICSAVFFLGVWYSGVNSKLVTIEEKVIKIEDSMVSKDELKHCREAIDKNTTAITHHVESFHTVPPQGRSK